MTDPRRIYDPADPADYRAALDHVADLQAEFEAARTGADDRIALALCRQGDRNES